MSERLPVANAMANRCSASSSFRIALWKNRKIKIGDSGLEHFKPPLRTEEESTLLTEFGSTATPPPSNGDAMRVLTFFFVISFLFSREIASEFKWLSTLSSSLLCMFLRNQLWVLYVVYPVEAWTVPERESGWREEKRRERERVSLSKSFCCEAEKKGEIGLVWFGYYADKKEDVRARVRGRTKILYLSPCHVATYATLDDDVLPHE